MRSCGISLHHLAYFTQHNALQIHPCCQEVECRSSFFLSATWYSIGYIYHCSLVNSFSVSHLGCFQHLAILNCAAMSIGVHSFFWIGVSGFLGYDPSSGIAGSKGSSTFSLLRKFILFSTVATPVCIPTNSVLGFPFLHNLASTYLLNCLWWPFWPVWSGISLWFLFASLWCLVMLSIPSYVSWPSVCPPWRREDIQRAFVQVLCLFFNFFFVFLEWVMWVLYIFWRSNPCLKYY